MARLSVPLIRVSWVLALLSAGLTALAPAHANESKTRFEEHKSDQPGVDGLEINRNRAAQPGGQLAAPETERPGPTAAQTQSGIMVRDLRFVGATALRQQDLLAATKQFFNRPLSHADLEALLRTLNKAYHDAGYFLASCRIPPQTIAGEILEIEIFEGQIDAVEIDGPAAADLKTYFAEVLSERPARLNSVEAALARMRAIAGIAIETPKIERSRTDQAAYVLRLRVKQAPLYGSVTLDNRGDEASGPFIASAEIGAHGVLAPLDVLEMGVSLAPQDPRELMAANLFWESPLNGWGTSLRALGSAYRSKTLEDDGSASHRSAVWTLGATLRHPVLQDRSEVLWLELGGRLRGETDEMPHDTPVETVTALLRPSLAFEFSDGTRQFSRLSLGAEFIALDPDERLDGHAFATALEASAMTTLQLAVDWSLVMRGRAQWSKDQLPDHEQFSLGGASFGRAYDYGEIRGETGAALAAELRYSVSKIWDGLDRLRLFAFADYGAVWGPECDGLPVTLGSAGVGVRGTFSSGLIVEVIGALPWTLRPEATGDRAPRLFVSVTQEF